MSQQPDPVTSKDSSGGQFKPHEEGTHAMVCVDVVDLGLVETEFQGVKKMVNILERDLRAFGYACC